MKKLKKHYLNASVKRSFGSSPTGYVPKRLAALLSCMAMLMFCARKRPAFFLDTR